MFNFVQDPFEKVPNDVKIKTLGLSKKETKSMTKTDIDAKYFLKSQLYEFLKELNITQMKVVLHKNGSILCSAVPGAGKTKTLVYKVAYLIEHCCVDPNRILVITFTKKAANEIRERIEKILSHEQDDRIISGTFHSVCHRFLKSLGMLKSVTHIDDAKQQLIIEEIVQKMSNSDSADTKFMKSIVKTSLNEIAKAKNELISPKDFKLKYGDGMMANIYEKYEDYMIEHNYVDYDNLLVWLVKEIRQNSLTREYLENRFDYVFVDEFQDTNFLQFEIVSCFANKSKNITIVGDSDQSIYGWRFADSTNIKKFKQTFPKHVVYLLNHSYRSTQHIINCANSVIQQEKGRINNKIVTNNEQGDKVSLYEFIDPDSEASYVCRKINNITDPNKSHKISLSQVAILLRTNYQSRIYEELLTKLKIPFQVLGNNDFYKSEEIQTIISYLKIVINKKDVLSFKKIICVYGDMGDMICQRLDEMGWEKFITEPYDERLDDTIKVITECTKMVMLREEPFKIVEYIVNKINLFETMKGEYGLDDAAKKWENVGELINLSQRYETLDTFLMDLATTENGKETFGPKVTILTIHSSKGLEWDVVYIPSIVESLIPHSRSIDPKNINSTAEISEERRLLYVAMTRAKKKLFLSYCRTIKIFGRKEVVQMSRFLKDFPSESFVLTKA